VTSCSQNGSISRTRNFDLKLKAGPYVFHAFPRLEYNQIGDQSAMGAHSASRAQKWLVRMVSLSAHIHLFLNR
jgi:hypothetical protein